MSGSAARLKEGTLERDDFTTDDFSAALIAGIALRGKQRLPIGAPSVERAFGEIVDDLQKAAKEAYKGGDTERAFEILQVLDGLRPSPNTGRFDAFWASLRRQQPGRVGVPNLRYRSLVVGISEAEAKRESENLPTKWQGLVGTAVEALAGSI